MSHMKYMRWCLELAERGRGLVGINPLVGAVLIRGEDSIAEGWHAAFGADHAERMLIKKFDQEVQPDDVLYVNLEPCCHKGKTPPCTDSIIESGIRNVVFGMRDPNPAVAGQGIALLAESGIQVTGPVLPELCRRLNRGYVSLQEQGRPFITLKRAQTMDGEFANTDGSRKRITSQKQDEWSHRYLRAKHDAILVGVQTVITDDPQLTVRLMNKKVDHTLAHPLRLILDPHLRVPLGARVVNGDLTAGTIIVTDRKTTSGSEQKLQERGVRILRIPQKEGAFDWQILWSMLTTPEEGFCGITSILVEGGPKTWKLFKKAGFVDEEAVLMGDNGGPL